MIAGFSLAERPPRFVVWLSGIYSFHFVTWRVVSNATTRWRWTRLPLGGRLACDANAACIILRRPRCPLQ